MPRVSNAMGGSLSPDGPDRKAEMALQQAISGGQINPAAVTDEATERVKRAFLDERLTRWLGNASPVPRHMRCERFSPNLFALIVTEVDAQKLLEDESHQEALASVVVEAATARAVESQLLEFGCITYADTPPHGRAPNAPAAVLTYKMDQMRERLLWNTVMELGNVIGDYKRTIGEVKLFLMHVRFPLRMNERLNFPAEPSVWDAISKKYKK